jgi:hypothetical protein
MVENLDRDGGVIFLARRFIIAVSHPPMVLPLRGPRKQAEAAAEGTQSPAPSAEDVIAGDGQWTTHFGEVFVWDGGEDEAGRLRERPGATGQIPISR